MLTVARKARPRRGPNRVRLVEPNGSPAVPWYLDPAPSWVDNHYWAPGSCPEDLAAHVHIDAREPEETDAEFLARLGEEEAFEKARVLATYQPSPTDLAEYAAWSEALANGTLSPAVATRFRFGILAESRYTDDERDAIRRGQVSEDELAMMASGMAI
jgi:hypothetical protein